MFNLESAIKTCQKSNHKQHRHAAFVVSGGAIVAFKSNFNKVHAEVRALECLWPSMRKGTKVYSIRFRKDGTFGNAKPCPKCEEYLRQNGVKTVFYTNTEGRLQKMKL